MNSRVFSTLRKQNLFFNCIKNVFIPTLKLKSSPIKSSQIFSRQFSISSCQHFSVDEKSKNEENDFQLDNINVDIANPSVEEINYDEICNGDPELIEQLKVLVLQVDSLYQDGYDVPSQIKTEDWKELLHKSKHQRTKYLRFLFIKEMKKINEKNKRLANRISALEKHELAVMRKNEEKHIFYGLQGNTMFHRIYDSYVNTIDNMRAMHSIQYGPHIILDLDYLDFMDHREQSLLVKQLVYVLAENRCLYEPYNIIFSSFEEDTYLARNLIKCIPNVLTDDFPFNYTTKHFSQLFTKNELVYLSPHSNDVLLEHEPGSVYIIGGMVDKRNQQPLSLAKAKKEGIRAKKLPLDHYLDWGHGNKSLTLNQMMSIMNDWRLTNNWQYAFRHIPRRKLYKEDEGFLSRPEEDNREQSRYIRNRIKKQTAYDLLLKRI